MNWIHTIIGASLLSTASGTSLLEILGGAGLYMVEASYLPQIARLHRLKEADEFSFLFPALNIIGRLFGLALAIQKHQPTFTWFFIVGIALRSVLMLQVVYYRTRKRRFSKEPAEESLQWQPKVT